MRVKTDGAELFVTTLGRGPDLVLVHPFPCSHSIWLPVAEALADDWRVTLYDLRGLGESSAGEGDATMQRHAEDLLRVCEASGITRAVFGGTSIGGYILFEFWRRHRERVRGLVLSGTKAEADTPEARANRLRSAEEVLKTGPADFKEGMLAKLLSPATLRNRQDIVEAVRGSMQGASADGIAAIQRGMAARPDSRATLGAINVPALLVFGEDDGFAPREVAEGMQKGIRGSRLVMIPEAGHLVCREKVEEIARVMREFLAPLR